MEREEDTEEERRVFYVGITRAKDKLYILSFGTEHSHFISPAEIDPNLYKKIIL
ncbi:MAG: hypothetical protein JXA99_08385 [Candidatus Lokiarchaeota archaeon]|nr:hypothetical protein [Candidatus Lokiarchaeota archaeon]